MANEKNTKAKTTKKQTEKAKTTTKTKTAKPKTTANESAKPIADESVKIPETVSDTTTNDADANVTTDEIITGTVENNDVAADGKAFGVLKETDEIETYEMESVKFDLASQHSEAMIEKFVAGEMEALQSGNMVYSKNRQRLEKIIEQKKWGRFAQPDDEKGESPEEDEPADEPHYELDEEIQNGMNTENELFVEIVQNENLVFQESMTPKEKLLLKEIGQSKKFLVRLSATDQKLWESIKTKFTSYGTLDADGQEPLDHFRKTDALAKQDNAIIEGEPMLPLSDEEKLRLNELIEIGKEAKNALDKAPRTIMMVLSEVREGKLYRESYATLEEFADKELGITRTYAQNLATFGDFVGVLNELDSGQIATSNLAIKSLVVDTNKIADYLGIRKSDFQVLAPIIKGMAQIIENISGDESTKPRVVNAVTDVIEDIVKSQTVEYEGEQISIERAKELGVLGLLGQNQIVEVIAENIRVQKFFIIEEAKKRQENRTKGHLPQPPKPKQDKTVYFKEKTPVYLVSCSRHPASNTFPENKIVKVFNAGFELKCGCKFQLLTTSGDEFVCIESEGLPIKQA